MIFCFRIHIIQEATNKNQDFQNAVQSMDFFLVNLPSNAIKPTDDVAQITAKQNSQKVRETFLISTSLEQTKSDNSD